MDDLIGIFWSVDSEAYLRDTGGTALAWAHTCCLQACLLGELSENCWEHDGTFLSEFSSGDFLEIFLLFGLDTFLLGDLLAALGNFLGGLSESCISLLQFFLECLGD